MNLVEAKKYFSDKTINERIDINPLSLIVHEEFGKEGQDYRERAIERIIRLDFNFVSEFNTLQTLLERIVEMHCPKCNKIMKLGASGGNTITTRFEYRCNEKCGVRIGISLANDAVDVTLKEESPS